MRARSQPPWTAVKFPHVGESNFKLLVDLTFQLDYVDKNLIIYNLNLCDVVF